MPKKSGFFVEPVFLRNRVGAFPDDLTEVYRVGIAFGVDQQDLRIHVDVEVVPQFIGAVFGQDRNQRAERDGTRFSGDDHRVALERGGVDAHALGSHVVGAGDESVGCSLEDFPGDRAGFATGETGHDGVE